VLGWPVATNLLSVGGDFTITAANSVNPGVPQGFYLLSGALSNHPVGRDWTPKGL
jgi:hypothetical protein